MNSEELTAALAAARAPGDMIEVNGKTLGGQRLTEGGFYLRREVGKWIFGSFERGKREPERVFTSEAEACSYAYDAVVGSLRTPAPQTDEERAEGRRKGAELTAQLRAKLKKGEGRDGGDE